MPYATSPPRAASLVVTNAPHPAFKAEPVSRGEGLAEQLHVLGRLVRRGTLAAAVLAPTVLWGGSATETRAQTYTIDRASNPLRTAVDVGNRSSVVFGDLDGDGDLDVIAGEDRGRLLYFENAGTAAAPAFTQRTGAANPLDGLDMGDISAPTLADLDGDGDLDVVVGEYDGVLNYFENTGTAAAPAFTQRTGAANPFDGLDVGNRSAPTFADLDGDGDLDVVVGESDGALNYFENTGTAAAPAFTQRTGAANPLGADVGLNSVPSLADLDGDGDLDVVVGERGALFYFENTGTAAAPAFTQRTGAANPLDGLDVGYDSSPVFADLDGDGDLDVVVGESDGALFYFENTGTAAAPAFTQRTGLANPFGGAEVRADSMPAFADLDGDGDLDAIVGQRYQSLVYFENTGTASVPAFTQRTGAADPFDGAAVGLDNAPTFGDLDGDDDLDLLVGDSAGRLSYFENTGTAAAPAFTQRTDAANPLGWVNVGNDSAPTLADLDGDGDLDLIVGEKDGTLFYFENEGIAAAPAFTQRTGAANPFDGVDIGGYSAPAFADLDGDGDLDAIVGEQYGALFYFENTGTAAAPAFTQRTGAANPLDGLDVGDASAPAFSDLDGDLAIEALVGDENGTFTYLETSFLALPVELTAFDVRLDGDAALLSWTTASETNNAGFEIERLLGTPGAEVAETLGFVGGAGTTLEAQAYTFRTASLSPGTHRFRLRQVDYDGAFAYSPIVEVSVAQAEALRLAAYPNPARGEEGFALEVSAKASGTLVVEVYDVLGRRVESLLDAVVTPGEVVSVQVGGLTSGVYFVRARQGSHLAVQRVNVVR